MAVDRSASPYYDDFDASKGFVQILQVPGRLEQAREFTQIQTEMHEQLKNLAGTKFTNGQVIAGCLATVNTAKTRVVISEGSVYADGYIVKFLQPSSVTITGHGTEVIGLVQTEEIITEKEDPSLRGPVPGLRNYGEPGSHRYKISWSWAKLTETVTGFEYLRLEDGAIPGPVTTESSLDPKKPQEKTSYLNIEAQRDFEQSGNYILSGLEVKIADHPDPLQKFEKKEIRVSAGKGRILGYDYSLSHDWRGDFEIARETSEVSNEPFTVVAAQDRYWEWNKVKYGGEVKVAEGPLDEVLEISAPVLIVCDGHNYGGDVHPLMVRGLTPGGTDILPHTPVEDIIDVAIGPSVQFNPATNQFENFTTRYVKGVDYQVASNGISWSLVGAEPGGGNSYAVAYVARVNLKKEILANALVMNELVNHNDTADGDKLDHQFICTPSVYNNYEMCITSTTKTGLPGKDFHSNYRWGKDFVVDDDGRIDWYQHDISVIQVTKGVAGGEDTIGDGSGHAPGDFANGFEFERVLAVAYYSNPSQVSFSKGSVAFVGATSTYNNVTDYTWTKGENKIDWAPSGAEPSPGQTYFIAVRSRRYLTLNHPAPGANYYVSYYYWQRKVGGDYISRDSYYFSWYGEDDPRNLKNRYGFGIKYNYLTSANWEFTQYINFWGSQNAQNNAGNINKPYPGGEMLISYTYCLNRYVIVELTEDLANPINIVYGGSSENPVEPIYDQNRRAVMLAIIKSPADALHYPIIVEKGVRTYKVTDLNTIKTRGERAEINLARTWVDLDAKTIPVENKKGVITSAFHDDHAIDRGWPGVVYSFDPDWEELALPHTDAFYVTGFDSATSSATMYGLFCTLTPNGTYRISQPYWSGDESIAPYATAAQLPKEPQPELPPGQDPPRPVDLYPEYLAAFQRAQSAYMLLDPTRDTLIIPRTVAYGTEADADTWARSDLAKLTNPTAWFVSGWVGNVGANTAVQNLTREYIREIQGNARQQWVAWNIPGGLIRPLYAPNADYFLYFADRLVQIQLTNSTPAGSVPNSFRSKADGTASGTFLIPQGVPEGRIVARATSTPMPVPGAAAGTAPGQTWIQNVTAIYDAGVVEKLIQTSTRCRCNCWCWCNCNCWDCRSRCGTTPLAQTIEPSGNPRVLKSIAFDFTKVSSKYGTYGCVVETQNGVPTTNTIEASMIARTFLPVEQMAGAGEKFFNFETPVILKDDTYAITVTGEDAFNINSINEVLAGRDIRCKIAKLGERDLSGTNMVLGSQPFKEGMLFRSLTAVTWEPDMKADMKFKADFYKYPVNQEQIVNFTSINAYPEEEITGFLLNWDHQQFENTSIIFEYKTQTSAWTEFSPYELVSCPEPATELRFRARLKTMKDYITPTVAPRATLYAQSRTLHLKAVTIQYTVDPSDTLDVYLDTHMPSDCTEAYKVTLDNGATFIDLDFPASGGEPQGNLIEYYPVDLNVDNVKYRHHWRITTPPGQIFTGFRLQMEVVAGGTDAKLKDPRLSRMIMIASVVL